MGKRRPGMMRRTARQLGWWLVWLMPAALVQRMPAVERLQRRAGEYDSPVEPVAEAAGILDTSEYDVLRIAFAETFGREPAVPEIGRVFTRYLLSDATPRWAITVALEVIALYDAGKLPQSRFAVQARPPATTRELLVGIFQSLLLLAILGMIYFWFATWEPL